MGLAWNICAPQGTLSTFFFNPVFRLSTAKNEINLFNNHVLIVATVTFAPAGAMTPSAEFLLFFSSKPKGQLTRNCIGSIGVTCILNTENITKIILIRNPR